MKGAMMRMLLIAAAFALGLCLGLKPAASATTYEFTFPFTATFVVQDPAVLPMTASFSAVQVYEFPALDWLNPMTGADFSFFVSVSVLDQNGAVVPQIPFGPAGASLGDSWNNCCGGTRHSTFFSAVEIGDPLQTLYLSGVARSQNMVAYDVRVFATIPDGLVQTPLPAAWGLFGSALVVLGGFLKSQTVGTKLAPLAYKLRWFVNAGQRRRHPELWELYLEEKRLPLVVKRLLSNPGDSAVVDVGAHIGSFAALALAHAETAILIEPIPRKADHLKKKFDGRDVAVCQVAVSDSIGEEEFVEMPRDGYSHLRNGDAASSGKSYKVKVDTLDNIVGNKPISLIKIDIEGHEARAFRGAKNVIARNRPAIIFECELQVSPEIEAKRLELFDVISGLDYQIFGFADFLHDRGPMDRNEFRKAGVYPFRAINFVAIPN
jgi:FkbM family methyltransferase